MPKVASLIAFSDDDGFFLVDTWPIFFESRATVSIDVTALDGEVNAVLGAGRSSSSSRRVDMVGGWYNYLSSTLETEL